MYIYIYAYTFFICAIYIYMCYVKCIYLYIYSQFYISYISCVFLYMLCIHGFVHIIYFIYINWKCYPLLLRLTSFSKIPVFASPRSFSASKGIRNAGMKSAWGEREIENTATTVPGKTSSSLPPPLPPSCSWNGLWIEGKTQFSPKLLLNLFNAFGKQWEEEGQVQSWLLPSG